MPILQHIEQMEGYEAFPAGALIIKEGEPGHVMYIVKEGIVEIRAGGRLLESVEPGGIVGEIALIDAKERSASVVARTDCQLLPVDEEQFVLLVEQVPYFALQVIRVLAARLRRATNRQKTLGQHPTPKKKGTKQPPKAAVDKKPAAKKLAMKKQTTRKKAVRTTGH
ncbi:MAG: cyclic nucleotide-binding domain-containing protein [Candidatus Binatia bacterium]